MLHYPKTQEWPLFLSSHTERALPDILTSRVYAAAVGGAACAQRLQEPKWGQLGFLSPKLVPPAVTVFNQPLPAAAE